MLEVQGLSVTYGSVQAVQDLHLTVAPGELVALIGANGAGKTSTLRAISGLQRPSTGEVRLDGRRIDAVPTESLPTLGLAYVPEGRGIFPSLSVEENLEVAAAGARQLGHFRQALAEVYAAFPRLAERRKQAGWSLSGGEQQMLAIGRAMVARPRMLLLDEPSLGLAPFLVREVFSIIMHIRAQGTGILLVEQNANLALRVADRAYVLRRGEVVLGGSAASMAADPRVQEAYLGV